MKYFTTLTYPFFQMERRAAPTPASGPRPDPLGMFGSKLKRFACSCLLGDDGIVPYYVATTTVTPFTVKKTMKVTDIGSMSTIYSGYATDKTVTITTATITATAEPEDLAIVTVTRTKTITEGTLDVTQVVPVPAPTVCAKVGAIMWPTKGAMGVANWYSRNRCRDFCAENSRYCRCFVWNKGTCRYFNHYCPEIYKADAMSSWEFYDQNCPIESLGKVGGD